MRGKQTWEEDMGKEFLQQEEQQMGRSDIGRILIC